MDRFRPGWVYDTTDQEPEQSDTIEGLAERLGLDGNELKNTVAEYNAASVGSFPKVLCLLMRSSINDKEFNLMKLDGKRTKGCVLAVVFGNNR
jgi:tricarballylate dehydrogenase